jgi:hypothetical protein
MTNKKKRPIGIYILLLLILWISGWNCLRLGEAVLFWNTLKAYAAFPLYIAISGGVWLILGLFLTWCIWQGKAWGRLLVMIASTGYTLWYWFDRLILQEPHANWQFVLASQFIFLLIIITILISKRTRSFFKRDADGRKPETPTPA